MAKLIYRTKHNKSWGGYQSFTTHESTYNDTLPSVDVQQQAMTLVDNKLRELIDELKNLGYDSSKVRFQIDVK